MLSNKKSFIAYNTIEIFYEFVITKKGMMKNMYQQQLMETYMNQCGNFHSSRNIYPCNYAPVLESNYDTGFLRLNIINQSNGTPVSNATITIYVTDGNQRDIPVMHLITTINPVRIELPMANELGTLIVGPEYDFSTYNLRVDAFGYLASNVYNIRLFPNVTTDIVISMIPLSNVQEQPVELEERLDIPPHLRDELS